MTDREILVNINKLEKKAGRILDKKRSTIPRRPIIIEFCGSPKAGKSSCMGSLDLFLRRNGYKTKVLTERASICPVESKHDPFFNIWTVSSVITELSVLLANNSKDYDILLLDRGIFDSLCWFEWLHSKERLDTNEYNGLITFLTLDRWVKAIDLIYVFTVSPEISFIREYTNLLTRKEGSIMKTRVLESYLTSINNTHMRHKNTFRKIELLDTGNTPLNDVNFKVTNRILNILDEYTSEQIGYVELNELPSDVEKCFNFNDIFKNSKVLFGSREKIESAEDKVQPLPITIITNKERTHILVAKKNKKQTSIKSPEKDKILLYFGGHTRKEDYIYSEKQDLLSLIRSTLSREVKEETNLDFYPSSERFDNPLCIWDKSNDRSKKHIAICHIMEVDFNTIKYKLDKNEFMVGNTPSGKIYAIEDLLNDPYIIEPWSEIILEKFFNKKLNNLLKYDTQA